MVKQSARTRLASRRTTGSSSASRPARRSPGSAPVGEALAPNLDRAIELAMELMAIPGRSGEEARVAEYITQRLLSAGASHSAIVSDTAHRKTPLGGEVGNLFFRLPGTFKAPRRLLMAHLDTVPICVGAEPVRRGEFVHSANGKTGLGADDRAGAAVILSAALEILERRLPHPPLVFFWPVQEEVGLFGARYADRKLLSRPRLAFNWDGPAAERVTVGATGGYRLAITIDGLASHAGAAPEKGVSAIAVGGLAIAELVRGGWHGAVKKGRHVGTSNVGVIQGGQATNVVADRVEIKAEARSHDPRFRRRIVREIERAFQRAARQVRSADGRRGKVAIQGRLDYESFLLPADDPSVKAAEAAIRTMGEEPYRAVSNGGLDANWMTAHGIPAVTLGCGQVDIHTTSEKLDLVAFRKAARTALLLATASEQSED